MAKLVPTFDTYTSIGMREDLSDVIYNIAPTETPFASMVNKVKATGRYHEWQTDTLASAAANAQVEGDEVTATAITPTVRLGNYCQIFNKVFGVSGTARAVDTAGRADEMDYQISRHGMELKRDIEFALTQNQASTAGVSLSARTLGSVESWLKSTAADATAPYANAGGGSTETSGGFASGIVAAPTDGTATSAPAEAHLKSVIRLAWTNGGQPDTVMAGPVNKQAISAYGGIATQYRDNKGVAQATILGAADVYVSDFGVHNIIPNRFNRERTILVMDMRYWAMAELRSMSSVPLAKTGDADKHMIVTELTLEARQPLASGKIVGCATS